ncbi:MAG: rhombotail lipoprotein [Psychromonas sp.]|jgi:rhombotail lipoprotein
MWSGVAGGSALTEIHKSNLLEKVANNFRGLDFVSDIEVIPSAYLTAGGGFANLEQIRTIYGIDVVALVSYDQVQFTDEGLWSLTYWTLVGAYVVSGEKNDTSTMLDTAVYDIQSQKMLFRAPGTSNVKGRSTPVNLSEELRQDSIKSFEQATDKMVVNLNAQLQKFKEKIKQNLEQVKVVHREGYSGGGATDPFTMLILMLLAGVLYRLRRRALNSASLS